MGFEDRLSNIRDLPENTIADARVFSFGNGTFDNSSDCNSINQNDWRASCYAVVTFFFYPPRYLSLALRKCLWSPFFFSNRNNCYDSRSVEKKNRDRSVTEFLIRSAWLTAWLHAKWKSINRSERSFVVSDEGLPGASGKIDGNRKSNYYATGNKRPLARLTLRCSFRFRLIEQGA